MGRDVSCCGILGDVPARYSRYGSDAVHAFAVFNHRPAIAGRTIEMAGDRERRFSDVASASGNE